MEKQVVSKKRVVDHGEVYTSKREVNAMLDLVKQETENLDSRFLEPACGTGNFLIEILERKLRVVESRYRKNQLEYERYLVHVVCSIYGIDILQDNVVECRKRLFEMVDAQYTRLFKKTAKDECRRVIQFILERNILWGDALTLMTVDGKPIVFSEWSFPFNNSLVKRRDFTFSDLLPEDKPHKRDMFSKEEPVSIEGHTYFIPEEKQTFPPVHFLKLE
jgi:hypothetical protein